MVFSFLHEQNNELTSRVTQASQLQTHFFKKRLSEVLA